MRLIQRLRSRWSTSDVVPPTYSNDAVLERLEREEKLDRETARAWFDEALIFLDLCSRSRRTLSPSAGVDKAWHVFLLHTRDYEAYCQDRFGRLIHHQPNPPDPFAYRRAYAARQRYAGGAVTPDPLLWPAPPEVSDEQSRKINEKVSAPCGGCGG